MTVRTVEVELLIVMFKKSCWWGDRLTAIVDGVPAGVCEQCGERYYSAKVLKVIEGLLKHKKRFNTKITIPLADYARGIR